MEVWAEKNYHLGEVSTDKVVFADLWKFGVSYWLIVALCIVFYSAIFPFQTFAVKFFMEAHGTSREFGGFSVEHADVVCHDRNAALWPVGGSSGQTGALLMMFGSLLLIPVYLMMAYTHINLYVPMAMMGVAFSLIPAVMWPSVAYIVDQSKLGTAYGLMTMIQNIGLFGLNLLVGWANNYSHADASNPAGYNLGMWIFSILGVLGVVFAFLLRQRELGPHGHGLETITTANSKAEGQEGYQFPKIATLRSIWGLRFRGRLSSNSPKAKAFKRPI
jgi:MFS family permease